MSAPMLIMACSATKRPAPAPVPADQLYDGPAWRTLRANRPAALDLVVLSAEHGFILGETPIAAYDHRLDDGRAIDLLGDISAAWLRDRVNHSLGAVYLCGGRLYRQTMAMALGQPLVDRLRAAGRLHQPVGRHGHEPAIGEQLGHLKAWLRTIAGVNA